MSRALVVTLAMLVLLAVLALDWYSHVVAGIASDGPVTLQSIAPRPTAVTPAGPAVRRGRAAPKLQGTQPPASASAQAQAQASPPQIISVSLSSPVVTGGQVVTGSVQTSSDVTSVQASIAGYSSALSKVGVGSFALSYQVPNLPFFLHRTYTIVVTARNALGETASSSLPVTVR